MKKNDRTRKRLLKEAHEIVKDLHDAGIADITTMKEFNALCLSETHDLSPTKIKEIRRCSGVSQAVFAKIINVSVAAIKQWERGERKPSGPALKILNLVETKGLDTIL
ncbi:MAG: transcriptional regulator [Gammaproteobacteria bacterium RIFCSPHIGHO2_12_FULL_41_15]|nr:MAG: transcriptional regulator [Gammaproteobacteria bacterium RIFCSPHIGHO2_12_FULL_41_15]